LQGKTEEEKMAILRPYNQQLVAAGYPAISPQEVGMAAPQIGGAQPAPAAQPAPPAQPATGAVVPTPVPAPVAPAIAPAAGTRPTGPQLAAQEKQEVTSAGVVGEDIGKVKANIGKIKENADYLTTKIDELITDPGFKYNVGVADVLGGIPVPFGSTVAGLFPGTEATDFKARFDEIKGQQFLQGIETLKGSGAISDAEGKAAQKAISRMSLSQSEAEFKKAADDFQGIIKRGVDRSLRKAGLEPLYNIPPASEGKREREKAQPGSRENPIKL
jgi:hypothetical protein